MSNVWRRMSAMPYTTEDFTHLSHIFVSHARFLTAGLGLGTAIVGINQWGVSWQLTTVKQDMHKIKEDMSAVKKHFKIDT